MPSDRLLIVDDEKNIRLTLSAALEPLGLGLDTAINGEEALLKLDQQPFAVMLLDLKMPGMDGIETLRRCRQAHPETGAIIITAHGTIDSAVEAMKLGAVDFIQKPFAPQEIRELVRTVLKRREIDESTAEDYASRIELAKLRIEQQRFDEALKQAENALALEPGRPEAFNLLGALSEIRGNVEEAQKSYRAALALDPTYKPARDNLSRTTRWGHVGGRAILEEPGAAPDGTSDEGAVGES